MRMVFAVVAVAHLAVAGLSTPTRAEGAYASATNLLAEGYSIVPVGAPFVLGLQKDADLFLCELNEFASSESLLVRRTIVEAIELRREPLVTPVPIPVTCFRAQ
jgi:hypothetical protein